ncbi:transporter [Zunongwangia sp.]|uniref:transporter n=1 Tax=Zunongwangia sp. TaxID=1965325 RepID=UPI003AA948EE
MFYQKVFLFSVFTLLCMISHAQYTETINSNLPGRSQGAYSVGVGVYQLEAAGFYEETDHDLLKQTQDIYGSNYALRIGVLTDILEISLQGNYTSQTTSYIQGGEKKEEKLKNFKYNTLGIKFMVYDPYKNNDIGRKINVRSWKANQKFDWSLLIPAISVYGGANIELQNNNPFRYEGESKYSPKAAIITQNNWGKWVFVMNFIADKFTQEYPSYTGIATLTHSFNPKWAVFGEYQGIISDIYADDLFRVGGAYLLNKDLQLDVSGAMSTKNTPSRWHAEVGFSYRLDFHKDNEFVKKQDGLNRKTGKNY